MFLDEEFNEIKEPIDLTKYKSKKIGKIGQEECELEIIVHVRKTFLDKHWGKLLIYLFITITVYKFI